MAIFVPSTSHDRGSNCQVVQTGIEEKKIIKAACTVLYNCMSGVRIASTRQNRTNMGNGESRIAPEIVAEYASLKAAQEQLMEASKQLNQQIDEAYEAIVPQLPDPVSRDECVSAMNRLIEEDRRFYGKWASNKQHLAVQLQGHAERLAAFERHFHEHKLESQYRAPVEFWMRQTRRETYTWRERHKPVDRALKLQLAVQSLVDNQDEDMRQWYLAECMPFGSHLDKKPSSKPGVVVETKESCLPLEIASLIYANCDLESCLELRQANSFWYKAFKQSDDVLENVLAARYPWFRLEGDLETWGDCMLVFVKRLATWNTAENFSDIQLVRTEPTPQRFITATTLGFGEKPPSGFSTIQTHNSACLSYNCGKLHLSHRSSYAVMDACTLETRFGDWGRFSVVSTVSTDEETILRVDGLEITLPKTIREEDLQDWEGLESPVLVRNHHILVRARDIVFLFSLEKPLHYENSFIYAGGDPGKEVGHIHFAKTQDKTVGGLHDPFCDELVTVPLPLQHLEPTASYKGLIWCREAISYTSDVVLVPTFVDLKAPTKIYYRRDRCLPISDPWNWLRQAGTSGNTHIVTSMSPQGLTLVDLDAESVTYVLKPDYEAVNARGRAGREMLLPGFDGNKFQVWYIEHESVKRYNMDIWGMQDEDQLEGTWDLDTL